MSASPGGSPITTAVGPGTVPGSSRVTIMVKKAVWFDTFYRPLHVLMEVNGGHNPLDSYWYWWRDRLL